MIRRVCGLEGILQKFPLNPLNIRRAPTSRWRSRTRAAPKVGSRHHRSAQERSRCTVAYFQHHCVSTARLRESRKPPKKTQTIIKILMCPHSNISTVLLSQSEEQLPCPCLIPQSTLITANIGARTLVVIQRPEPML